MQLDKIGDARAELNCFLANKPFVTCFPQYGEDEMTLAKNKYEHASKQLHKFMTYVAPRLEHWGSKESLVADYIKDRHKALDRDLIQAKNEFATVLESKARALKD